MSKNVLVISLQKPFDISSIEVRPPFVCLVYSNQEATDDEIRSVATSLVSSGCRYAVCAGKDCEVWHDAIDYADINEHPDSDELVMTTWHKDETVEEIVSFWLNSTDFDDIVFENYLVLLIGDSKVIQEEIQNAIKSINL